MKFDLNLHIKDIVNKYLKHFPYESDKYSILLEQLHNNENIWTRKNFTWHITASSFIFLPDFSKFVVIKNINLNKWLVPGWHWEEWDNEIWNNAQREAKEETGLENIELYKWHLNNEMIPIDIDTHYIPENIKKQELEHYHHDFRYIFVLSWNVDVTLQLEEVDWFEWYDINWDLSHFSSKNVIEKMKEYFII